MSGIFQSVLSIIVMFFLPGMMLAMLGLVCHEDCMKNPSSSQKHIDGKIGRIVLPILSLMPFAAGVYFLWLVMNH